MKAQKLHARRLCVILFLMLSGHSRSANGQLPFQHKPSFYWIDTKFSQEIYDDQVLQMMGNTAAGMVLHVNITDVENPTDNNFTLKSIMSRCRTVSPNLPILMYSWTTIGDPDTADYTPSPNPFFPIYYLCQQGSSVDYVHDSLIHYPMTGFGANNGKVYTDVTGKVLGDVTSPASGTPDKYFMGWIEKRIIDTMQSLGFDGIMNDNFHPAPFIPMPQLCPSGRGTAHGFCDKYYDSVIKIVTDIKAAIGSKPFIFNGLTHVYDHSSDTQQMHAALVGDGATVEYFGYTYNGPDTNAADQVIPYIRKMSEYQNAHIFCQGRGISAPYVGYCDDLAWERYELACYLLGKNDNTGFHYFVDFSIPTADGGRATPLDYYDDMRLIDSLGAATVIGTTDTYTYNATTGIYQRAFTGGSVFVHPYGISGSGVFSLTGGPYYMLDSLNPLAVSGGTYTLSPGQGLILLKKPVDSIHYKVSKTFQNGATEPTKTWEYCTYSHEASNWYDELFNLPAAQPHLHDLMLDWNRSDSNWHSLAFNVRGESDANAAFFIAADVESADSYMQVVFCDTLNSRADTEARFVKNPVLLFRQPQVSASALDSIRTWYIPVNLALSSSHIWQTIHLNGDSLLKKTGLTGYTFKRFVFVRFKGHLDIDSFMLPDPMPLVVASSSSATICTGGSSTLTATGTEGTPPFSYTWSPATGLAHTTGSSVTASPTVTTTYTVTLTDANSLTATATTTVSVVGIPVTSVTSTVPSALCSGSSTITPAGTGGAGFFVKYVWTSSDGSFATTSTAAVSPVPTTTTTYSVTVVTSAPGCTGTTATTTVTKAALPTITYTASPTAICVNGTTTITTTASGGTGAQTYGWSGPGITSVSGSSTAPTLFTPSVTASPGTYTVTYSSTGQGCTTAVATQTVTVASLPVPSIVSTIPTALCSGSATITPTYTGGAGSLVDYVWSKPSGVTTTSTGPITITPTATITYSVTVNTDGPGCTGASQAITTVTVSAQPAITFTMSPTHIIKNGTTTVTGTATGGTGTKTYGWSGPGIATVSGSFAPPSAFTPTVVANPGTYTVTFSASGQGCVTAVTTHTLSVTASTPQTTATGFDNNMQQDGTFNWELYPNPTRDVVNITATTLVKEDLRFELNDVAGRTLKTTSLMLNGTQTVSLKVSELPAGTYFISLYRNNIMYETKKLVLVK